MKGTTMKMKQKTEYAMKIAENSIRQRKRIKRKERVKLRTNQGKKKKNHKGFNKKSSKNEGKEKACEASNNGGSEKRIVTNFLFHEEERERKN